jgi:hypothetical protein
MPLVLGVLRSGLWRGRVGERTCAQQSSMSHAIAEGVKLSSIVGRSFPFRTPSSTLRGGRPGYTF